MASSGNHSGIYPEGAKVPTYYGNCRAALTHWIRFVCTAEMADRGEAPWTEKKILKHVRDNHILIDSAANSMYAHHPYSSYKELSEVARDYLSDFGLIPFENAPGKLAGDDQVAVSNEEEVPGPSDF